MLPPLLLVPWFKSPCIQVLVRLWQVYLFHSRTLHFMDWIRVKGGNLKNLGAICKANTDNMDQAPLGKAPKHPNSVNSNPQEEIKWHSQWLSTNVKSAINCTVVLLGFIITWLLIQGIINTLVTYVRRVLCGPKNIRLIWKPTRNYSSDTYGTRVELH